MLVWLLCIAALLPRVFTATTPLTSLCSDIPTPSSLSAVSVWVKHLTDTSLFRISDEDLTDEGFMRSAADRDSFVVLLSRNLDTCSQNNCSIKLQHSRRLRDGAEVQQENIIGTPLGYEALKNDFYCARSIGDCGAELPIYQWVRGKNNETKVYAYTFDPSASISGYIRDVVPICYGWSDEGSIIPSFGGNSVPQNETEICARVGTVQNAKISYSTAGSSLFPIGTTAILQCSSDYVASGQTSLVCTKNGWYPSTGLGGCINNKNSVSNVSPNIRQSSTSLCSSTFNIPNGALAISNPNNISNPKATVLCNLGYISTFSEIILCADGEWQLPNIDSPLCIQASEVKCLPPLAPMNGHIKYVSNDKNPFKSGSKAELLCEEGFALVGNQYIQCTTSGWNPPIFGTCQPRARSKRQELATTSLGCAALFVVGGNVTYVQSSPSLPYSSGTSALLICNPGYQLEGSFSSSCTNGQWLPAIGTCTLGNNLGTGFISTGNAGGTCTDLMTPLNGVVTYTPLSSVGLRSSGTVATLSCNMGYTVSGSLSASCSNGVWSPMALGSCISSGSGTGNGVFPSLDCATPTVTNGILSFSLSGSNNLDKPSGTIATISCNLGFELQGFPTSTCQNGLWSPPIPTCGTTTGVNIGPGAQMNQCSALLPPLGGSVNYSTGNIFGPFATGTTAYLSCTHQEDISGASSAVCQSGQWVPPNLGTCSMGLQCGGMILPLNGVINYSAGNAFGPFRAGTVATLTCSNGAAPTGSQSAVCTNGQWEPTMLGSCFSNSLPNGNQCTTGFTVNGGSVSYSSIIATPPFVSGTIATVTCLNGNNVIGSQTSTCQNGIWNPAILGTCTDGGGTIGAQCMGGVSGPMGSTITYSNGGIFGPFPGGTTATSTCSSFGGLDPNSVVGISTATCLNGVWNPSTLTGCQQGGGTGQCLNIPPPFMGSISYTTQPTGIPSTYTDGTVATLTCSTFVQGSSTARCISGTWTPTLGVCNGSDNNNSAQCATPPMTPFGATLAYSNQVTIGPWTSGTTVTMTCPLGQFPQGPSMSVCEGGIWNPPLATSCSTTSISGNGCLPIASLLSPITNGQVVYIPNPTERVAIGTVASLVCDPSHQVSGGSKITCTSMGWSPSTLGQCLSQGTGNGATCTALLAPANGLLTYSQGGTFGPYPTGTTAQVTCNIGYNINGASLSACQNGQWIPFQIGQCIASDGGGTAGIQCPAGLPAVPFGTLVYSNGMPIGPYSAGTEITLTCSPNYNPSGSTRSICSNGVWTPSLLGSCIPSTGTLIQCQAIPFIWSGSVSYTPSGLPPYNEGTVATLNCNIGSIPSGISSVTCQGGSWTPFPGLGSCTTTLARSPPKLSRAPAPAGQEEEDIPKSENEVADNGIRGCPGPLAPPFGEITFSRISSRTGTFAAGTTAALRCVIGYSIEGASFSTCQRGMFRPMLGKCSNGQVDPLPGACLPLAHPEQGKITYIQSSRSVQLEIGSTALLKCTDPLRAVTGTAALTCTASGWEPAEGFGTCDDMRNQIVDVENSSNSIN